VLYEFAPGRGHLGRQVRGRVADRLSGFRGSLAGGMAVGAEGASEFQHLNGLVAAAWHGGTSGWSMFRNER
jgi:hypothetical protein